MSEPAAAATPALRRAMGLLEATATNVISMVGVGPFLTIPFMVAAMNGPHVLYAWLAGLVLALADGLVYAQLGAALPGSGGGYLYLREAFRPFGLGRLMGFLFIFQTILIAPLSVAGGAVGFADYLKFVWTSMSPLAHHLTAATVCVAMTALLWRNIEEIGTARGRDARGRSRDGRVGHRRRALHVLARAGVRLSSGGVHARSQPAHERRSGFRAGDVQLRRLQPGLQHRRGDPRSDAYDSAFHRPLHGARRRALHPHDGRDRRDDPVGGSAGLAHGRLGLHRANVQRSRQPAGWPAS